MLPLERPSNAHSAVVTLLIALKIPINGGNVADELEKHLDHPVRWLSSMYSIGLEQATMHL